MIARPAVGVHPRKRGGHRRAGCRELTLLPGDVILTGTPGGIGPIQSGDRLEVRIQGLAPLVNTVK